MVLETYDLSERRRCYRCGEPARPDEENEDGSINDLMQVQNKHDPEDRQVWVHRLTCLVRGDVVVWSAPPPLHLRPPACAGCGQPLPPGEFYEIRDSGHYHPSCVNGEGPGVV